MNNITKNYEYLNSEYQNIYESTEYKLGRKILTIKENLVSGHVIQAIKSIFRIVKSGKKRQINNSLFVNTCPMISDKKVAVYTCVTGDYDSIQDPLFIEENCDYFIVTNNVKLKSNVWKVIDISKHSIKDNVLLNRYVKFHPHEFFAEYDYTIYIDGNIQIVSNISGYITHCDNAKIGISMHTHCSRDCVYDEIDICKTYQKGNSYKLDSIGHKCKKINLEKHFGLFECGVIVTHLNNENALKVFEYWWHEFSVSDCRRDQILLPYTLKSLNFLANDIGVLGNNIYKNPKFKLTLHTKQINKKGGS